MSDQTATKQSRDEPECLDVLQLVGRFEVRGSSTQTLNIAEWLRDPQKIFSTGDEQEVGVRARVLCLDASRLSLTYRQKVRVEEVGLLGWPLIGFALRRYLLSSVIEAPPDLIHIQGLGMHRLGRWLSRSVQKPYVMTLHREVTPRDSFRLDRTWGRQVIATSEAIQKSVLEHTKTLRERVQVIRSGVKRPPASRCPEVLPGNRRPTIGTAGPLETGQGLSYFLKAIPKVLSAGPPPMVREEGAADPQFLIAGAGPSERELRQLARELGVDGRTTFVSNLYDFSESLAAMDVFCVPTERPGMGITMLEAMARGVPVIATAVGNATSVIKPGETGILIPSRNSDAIAEAITGLLRDPPRARRMAAAGKSLVERDFPLDNMLSDMLDVYLSATGSTGQAVAT